ncbi:MAG: HAD-IB family phosphatase, partial [Firmicutes bacterium]|nr:HAD-IB family phosphatase [Bacillota bacterium]
MNVYDFDGTIYSGDSTADFYKHCLKKYPKIWKTVPRMVIAFGLYIVGIYEKTKFKEIMYRFLTCVPDIEGELEIFWDSHMKNIKPYYSSAHKDDDVVISASPEFLLKPACGRLGIKTLIASRVDMRTGKYDGLNCRDTEKVRRFHEWDRSARINDFYSDSTADAPLAELAENAYMVRGDEIIAWSEYKPPKYKMFLSREFLTFLAVGIINTFAGSLFATLYSSFIPNATAAFVPGWITGNVLSYFLNSIFTFKDTKFGFVKYFKFLLSNIPNLVIQTVMVQIFSTLLHLPNLLVYG